VADETSNMPQERKCDENEFSGFVVMNYKVWFGELRAVGTASLGQGQRFITLREKPGIYN